MSMPMMPMLMMTERQRPAGDDDDNDVDGDYGDDPLYIMSDNDSLLKVTITMMIVMTRGQRSTIRHERQRPAGDDDDDGHDLLYGTNGNDDDRAATTRCTNGNDPLYGFPFLTNPHGLTS